MRTRITKEERAWGLAQHETLSRLINEGKWEYSLSKLQADFQVYRMYTWIEVHPFWAALILLFYIILFSPMGFLSAMIVGILFAIAVSIQRQARERYEVALGKLKHGKSFGAGISRELEMNKEPKDRSEDVKKLYDLFKSGALTQAEFESEKKRILNGRSAE